MIWNLMSILLSLLATFGIKINYNFGNAIFLVAPLILFIIYKFFKPNKNNKYIVILALIFSILLVFGKLCYINLYTTNNIILDLFRMKNIISVIGLFIIIESLLNLVLTKLIKHEFKNRPINLKNYQIFLIIFIIIVILWLPYLLSFFPGTLSQDSLGILKVGIARHIKHDSQPVIHQLLLIICNILASSFSANATATVIIYTFIQFLVLSLIVSYTIYFIYINIKNKYLLLVLILFYGFIPIFGYYSIVMWKDVFYGAFVLLLTIYVYKLINVQKYSIFFYASFYLVSLICLLFRTNAIYMYVLLIIATLILQTSNRKKVFILYAIIVLSFFIIKYPVFNSLNIARSASAEYIAIPLQQVGRMRYKNVSFTNNEKEIIDNLIGYDILKETYDPKTSDGIKFNQNYNGEYFDKNKGKMLKMWISLCFKYPSIAFESYFISTLGYWYPELEGRYYENTIIENELGIEMRPVNNKVLNGYVKAMGNTKNPIIKTVWSAGLYSWVLLISMIIVLKKKTKKLLIVYIPVLGNLLTLFVATPVFNETRYVFSLYLCILLLLLIPFFSNKNCERVVYNG